MERDKSRAKMSEMKTKKTYLGFHGLGLLASLLAPNGPSDPETANITVLVLAPLRV